MSPARRPTMHILTRFFFFLVIGLQAGGAAAALYKCEDPQGGISYSDRPCPVDEESQELGHVARSNSQSGPGQSICREVQDFGTQVAELMRKKVDSNNVMNRFGGLGSVDDVAMQVINYVYSFKSTDRYSPGRIGGLVFNKCMGGGFPFPESTRSAGKGSGSGFIVDNAGHILTNNHVVEKCASVEIADGDETYTAEVLARQVSWDLALLKAKLPARMPAPFRAEPPPELGENVIVAGYPLKGLLASDLQVTKGSVSALAGISNDTRMIQITAPVQPGNSGGPLFDEAGAVIGVVVAKLNTVELARRTGDIAQNVNFAIKGRFARQFLRSHNVAFLARDNLPARRTTEVATGARESVVPVICH